MENFGKIKNVYNGILADSIVSKSDSSKLLFKKYIKAIKESEILKTQFLIYDNIENKLVNEKIDSFTLNMFIDENIKLLKKFTKEEILKENTKLLELSSDAKNITEDYNPTIASLHESIAKLIFTKRSPNTVEEITEAMGKISEYIKANKPKEIREAFDLPPSMISNMLVEKYNEKYSTLDELDKKVLKTLINSTDDQKKEVYTEMLKECLELVNRKIDAEKETNKESFYKLLKVKEKLLNDKQEINEDFNKNISKLIELKSGLLVKI